MRGRRTRSLFDRPNVFCAVDALSSVHLFAPFLNLAVCNLLKIPIINSQQEKSVFQSQKLVPVKTHDAQSEN